MRRGGDAGARQELPEEASALPASECRRQFQPEPGSGQGLGKREGIPAQEGKAPSLLDLAFSLGLSPISDKLAHTVDPITTAYS